MLYKEIIAICSEIHTKHINTLCVEFVSVKPGGTKSHQWAINIYVLSSSKQAFFTLVFSDLPLCLLQKENGEKLIMWRS
jgi:hypothetical protein